jgi:hypothetical protein
MYELQIKLERYLRVNLMGQGPRLIKKNLPGRGLTKVENHWSKVCGASAKGYVYLSNPDKQQTGMPERKKKHSLKFVF